LEATGYRPAAGERCHPVLRPLRQWVGACRWEAGAVVNHPRVAADCLRLAEVEVEVEVEAEAVTPHPRLEPDRAFPRPRCRPP